MQSLNQLESFIIFDPTLSKNEEEDHLKILYFYPKSLTEKSMLYTIGLCEAMNNFSKEFTNEPCQFIQTLKSKIIMSKLEGSCWIVMTVKKTKSSSKENDYKDDEVQNEICAGVLRHCQKMMWLFVGPISLKLQNNGVEGLKDKFGKFFDNYINQGMIEGYQITDTLTGIHMLPVDKDAFTQVQSFINQLEVKFQNICGTLFLSSNCLVYGTICKDDLGILYRYLTITLLPNLQMHEVGSSIFNNRNMGKYLTSVSDARKVYLNSKKYIEGNVSYLRHCFIHIYKVLHVQIVLFIDESTNNMDKLLSEVHDFMGPIVTQMSQSVFKKIEKIPIDSPFRYLYWNPDTLSIKCTLFPTRQLKPELESLVPQEVMQLITDIASEICTGTTEVGMEKNTIKEFGVKLYSDSWVVCMKRNQRHLFLAINKHNFSLVDVSKELKQVCNRDFPTLFTVDFE